MRSLSRFQRGAFTLIELLLVVAIIALLVSILLPALASARKAARMSVCLSNQKQLGVAMHTYANDFSDHIYSYSWKRGQTYSQFGDLNNAASDVDAACNQMTDIARRLGDRSAAETPAFTPSSFFPYMRFSHMVLQDYLGSRLPDPTVACPEDRSRLQWGLDPRGYDAGKYTPNFGTGGLNWRWPYSSSYWITVSSFDKNSPPNRAYPAPTYGFVTIPNAAANSYGNRKISDVAMPGNKVFMYEQFGRHGPGKFDYRQYYGFATAKVVVQLFDNSVQMRASKDANRGDNPNTPLNIGTPFQTQYDATGATPDPMAPPNVAAAMTFLRYQYTRGGLKGVDFGGKEIPISAY